MKLELDFKTKEAMCKVRREMQNMLSMTKVLIDSCYTDEFAEAEDIRRVLFVTFERFETALENFEEVVDF